MRLPAATPRGAPRLLAFVLAFSLAAAACGGGGETATIEADDSASQADAGSQADAASQTESTEAETSTTSDSNEADADGGAEEAAPAIENLFPDVDVVNVTDGASVNLAAELGGGDTPVLLWFWAPH